MTVFNKADKPSYFLMGVEMLRPGGLIVVDNALWFGRVADPKIQDSVTTGVRRINEAMKNDARVDFACSILTMGWDWAETATA